MHRNEYWKVMEDFDDIRSGFQGASLQFMKDNNEGLGRESPIDTAT
jgi:hypothetical protein